MRLLSWKSVSLSLLLGLALAIVSAPVLPSSVKAGEKEEKKSDEKKSEEKTKEVKAKGLTLTVPEGWETKEPSGFRVAQLAIPVVEKDKGKDAGEYTVFYFAMGGGDAAANVKRWIGQFEAEGRKAKVFTGQSKSGKYTLVDVSGTFNKNIGPPVAGRTKKLEGWRMMSVVLEADDATYYIRFDAPQATAATAEDAFRKSFGANPKEEKEQKPE